MLSSCKGRVLTSASVPFYPQMTGLHMIIRKPLPCKQNFLSLLLIKRVSVSGIHVGSFCSFYKRNSSSVNITKLRGLDGLSSKLYFGGRLLELSSLDKLNDPKRINLPIFFLFLFYHLIYNLWENRFNSLSIFVQIICPETTGNFYSLKPFFSSWEGARAHFPNSGW